MKTRLRLLPTVLACLAILVLLSVGSMLVLNLMTSRTIVSELGSRVVARSLSGLELALQSHMNAAANQADYIVDAFRSADLDFDDRNGLAQIVAGSLAAAPQITGILVADAKGDALRILRTASGSIERGRVSVDASKRLNRIADETRVRRQAYWGPPIYSKPRQVTLLNLRVPIWRGDDYLGFMIVGTSTQELSQLCLQLSEPPRSTVFVLYGREKVLAHMFLASQNIGLSVDKPLPSTSQILDPVIGRLDDAVPFASAGFTPPEGVSATQLEAVGERYLVIQKPVAGYGDVPLVLGSYSLASAVETPFRTAYRAVWIGAGLFVMALVLSFAIARMIATPVRETAESASTIASLEFERASPLPPSRIKELDELSKSFNAMLVGLKSFGRYVPRSLVTRLIRENRVGAGTEERELTVMFTDIAGFTSTCEGMAPAEVAAFINHHLTIVGNCIEAHGGTIDKYIGDAVMAFWGAPDAIEDAPIQACRAAQAIQRDIAADNEKRVAANLPPVRIRIGIHSGPLIVGDIGAPNRINYTVVGDVVNTAQRLEGLGKQVDPEAQTIVLISEATRNGLDDTIDVAEVGQFKLKGKTQDLDVYRIAP